MSYTEPIIVPRMASPVEKALVEAILRVKRSSRCVVCGNQKETGRWLDRTCYFTLPLSMRNRLWSVHEYTDAELRDNFITAINYLAGPGQRFVPRQRMPLEAQQIIAETRFSECLTAYLTEDHVR